MIINIPKRIIIKSSNNNEIHFNGKLKIFIINLYNNKIFYNNQMNIFESQSLPSNNYLKYIQNFKLRFCIQINYTVFNIFYNTNILLKIHFIKIMNKLNILYNTFLLLK